jgi:pyruvate,water dikinase
LTEVAPYIVWFEEVDATSVHLVGGKCASLGELRKTDANVPIGFAVTTHAHREFLRTNAIHERLGDLIGGLDHEDVATVARASRDARAVVESATLPEAVEHAIRETYATLVERCGGQPLPVAVRSSATAEDHYTASFAGQLETYLWVLGVEAVLANVLRCWGGLYTPHALTYRQQMGFGEEDSVMSVGVQEMVDARSAGVMFTMNPVDGDRSKVMIEACWGLGEGIVRGDVNPDRFLIDKVTLEVLERVVADKQREYRFNPATDGVEPLELDEQRSTAPSLSDDEAIEIASIGKRIERHYGRPQDIEWAVGSRRGGAYGIHVLQSRAETVWSQRQAEPIAADGRSAVDRVIASFVRVDPKG